MVQELSNAPKRRNTFNQIMGGIAGGAKAASDEMQLEQSNQAFENQGYNLTGIRDPEERKLVLQLTQKERELNSERTAKNQKLLDELTRKKNQTKAIESQYQLREGTLEAFEDNPSLAASVFKPKAEPKVPRPRLSEEPINPEQLKKIQSVRNNPEFSKASPSKKYQMLTDNEVSQSNARAESEIAAEEEKISIEKIKGEEKKSREEKKHEFEEKIRVHKESEDFDKQVLSAARTAKKTLANVKEARNAFKSGKVKPTSAVSVLSHFGKVGDTLANAIKTKDHAAVQALMPEFLEGKKELFGVRLSDADLNLLQDKSIDISKSPEANEEILNLIEKYADQSVLRGDIAAQIAKNHEDYRPIGYERKVDEEFDRQMTPIQMENKSTGKKYSIPAYRVGSAIKKGLSVVNE